MRVATLARSELQDIPIPVCKEGIDYHCLSNTGAVAFEHTRDITDIPTITIDSLEIGDASFIKVDCQGADFQVLLGARQTIDRCRPLVVFESEQELENSRGVCREDYFSFFSELGYSMKPISYRGNGKQVDFLAWRA